MKCEQNSQRMRTPLMYTELLVSINCRELSRIAVILSSSQTSMKEQERIDNEELNDRTQNNARERQINIRVLEK